MDLRRKVMQTGVTLLLLGFGSAAAQHVLAETVRLDRIPHIHGMETSKTEPGKLLLATHQGLYLASAEGTAEKISEHAYDMMGFAGSPEEADVLYGSGHPPSGGNIGVIRSEDGGRTWTRLSPGVDGPVDFHAMAVSGADADILYGVHGGLQMSRDGGRSWTLQGPLPNETYDIAASTTDTQTVYAATAGGLKVSRDAGKSWAAGHLMTTPSSMVHTTPDGAVYAFAVGQGLIATKEPALNWTPVSNAFGPHVLLHLAADPADPERLYGVAETGGLVTSPDGGKTWVGYEGSYRQTAERVAQGKSLYQKLCQSCHGSEGSGEPPENLAGSDLAPAPALDNSAHAWHHSDADLMHFILEGFQSQGGRMPGWKDQLSPEQAGDIVAYMKSKWNFRSFACQGARHMACGAHGQRN